MYPQTSSRSVGALSTLDGHHRFELRPSYQAIADLPLAERVEAMQRSRAPRRDPVGSR